MGNQEIRKPDSLPTRIARNTFLNIVTQVAVVAIALWAIPILVRGLAEERFGLLSIVWVFIGYFTLLDLGLSRANTKFLAEAVAAGDAVGMRKIVWTSLSASLILGVAGGGMVILVSPFMIRDVFEIEAALVGQAGRAFVIAGLGMPFMLIFGTLKGYQMALQRFGIFNMFQGLNGVLQWGGSVALLAWGFGLEEIVLLTVASRVVLVLVAFAILPQFIPNLFASIPLWDRVTLRKLISFGGWVTVSQLISPLFMYVDRVFIGMFLSLAAVAYYTVPQEALTRVLIVPMSLTTTLFPAMSGQPIALDQANKTAILYYRSLKYLTIIMVPLVLSFLLFSSEILRLWLGDEFAAQSVTVFQILALGILVNSLSQVPTTALHAFGRPDITAKFHIIELPLMVVLNLILIPSIGIAGAAIAWTLRVWIDGLLLFLAAQRRISETYRDVGRMWTSRYAAIQPLALLVLAAAVLLLTDGSTRIAVAIVGGVLYVVATWLYSFDEVDRNFFLQLRSRIFG